MKFKWQDAEPADLVEHSGHVPDPVELRRKYERRAKDLRKRIEKLRGGALTAEESDELRAIEAEIDGLERELSTLSDMLRLA